MIIYGQRTADGRIAFGGRGAPYHFGSSIGLLRRASRRCTTLLRQTLAELFPALAEARFTHAWGGPLGIPRDWHSSVGLDRASGLAWAGGYVGDGVSTTNLAGRTLADLITGSRHGRSCTCPGSVTAPRAGSPSRCAGSASTPGSGP